MAPRITKILILRLLPFITLGLLAPGCSPPKRDEPPPPAAPSPTPNALTETSLQAAPGAPAETAMQAYPVPAAAAPQGNLLRNADFSEMENFRLAVWEAPPGTKKAKTDRRQNGAPVLEVDAGAPEGGYVQQVVAESVQIKPGQTYRASAWVRLQAPGGLMLVQRGTDQQGQEASEEVTASHPGDGAWHKLELTWQVPEQLMPGLKELVFQARIQKAGKLEMADPQVVVE